MLPGFHWFGSRVWYDRNWQIQQGLGEDNAFPPKWNPGTPPALPPRNQITGTPPCLVNGDSITDATPDEDLIDGFPSECFLFPNENLDSWARVSATNVCSLQRFYAAVIGWLYDDDDVSISQAFDLLLGPGYVVTVRPQVANLPALATCIGNNICIVVLDGTRTFQQLALQGLYSLGSPTNFGILGTNPFWYDASDYIFSCLQTDGLVAGMRLMIAGHSYGAAVSLLVAARLAHADTMADLRYLTFGCPKPGDLALQELLRPINGLNIADDDDIITVLPPDYITLLPVALVLGVFLLDVWTSWLRPENQFQLNRDGTGTFNSFPLLDYSTLFNITTNVLAGAPISPINGHTMVEYQRRLNLRCPGNIWPVSKELDDLIDAGEDMLLEDLTTMQQETLFAMRLEE